MTDTPRRDIPPSEPYRAPRRKSVARAAGRESRRVERAIRTGDSFLNLPARIGQGADNQASFGTYGFNPITRLRLVLDFAYRGSWICRKAIKSIPEDLFREGLDLGSELSPDDRQILYTAYSKKFAVAKNLRKAMQWGRLYGGAIAVMMIDGQRPETPLRVETVGKNQFCGLYAFDRWMLNPSLNDLVTDMHAPDLGLPKYYEVVADSPVFPRQRIHHSRVVRFDGDDLPYYQGLAENTWTMSVLEPVFDRIKAFDAATMGTAQLVYRAHMRVLKIPKWRDVVGSGGPRLDAALAMIDWMRRFQGNEGITVIDGEDDFQSLQYAFTGLDSVLLAMGQQLSGAIDTPLVRLFGQAPAGLNATGESDWRMYYDSLRSRQEADVRPPLEVILRVIAKSEGIELPKGFSFNFLPLWQMTPEVKATVSSTTTTSVTQAHEAGLIGRKTALKELKQSSHETGIWSNITEEDIDAAEDEPPAMPGLEGEMPPGMAEASSEPPAAELPGSEPPAPEDVDSLPRRANRRSFLPGWGRARLRLVGGEDEGAFLSPELEREERRSHPPLFDPYGPGRALHIHDSDMPGRRISFAGYDVVVEVEAGQPRHEGSSGGAIMAAPYGFLSGTVGNDGDSVDVFLGPNPTAGKAYILAQQEPDPPNKFHQHKVFLGYDDPAMVTDHFLRFYADGRGNQRLRSGTVMSMDEFNKWLARYRKSAA